MAIYYLAAEISGDINDPNLNANNMQFVKPAIFTYSTKQTASAIAYQYRIKHYHHDLSTITPEKIRESMKVPVLITSLTLSSTRESQVISRTLSGGFTYDNLKNLSSLMTRNHRVFIEGQLTNTENVERLVPSWLTEKERHTLLMFESDPIAMAIRR